MSSSNVRVRRHRQKASADLRRVEVSVKEQDVERIRRAASVLRLDGEEARSLRKVLDGQAPQRTALDMFREIRALWPPGPPLDIGREDLAPDRDIDL